MLQKITIAAAAVCMATHAVATTTTKELADTLEPRQGGFIETIILGVVLGVSGILKDLLGPEKPACTWDSDKDPNNQFWVRAYFIGADGLNHTVAEICWTGGGYAITEDDAAVVDCLMDLHVNQETTCIDTEGSSCDVHPGTAVGNVRNIYDLSTSNDQQIDSLSAERTKEAFRQMIAHEHGWDIASYMSIYPMNDEGTYTSWSVGVRGTGSGDC